MLDELGRRQAVECGVRAELVVIDAPGFDRGAGMEDGRECVLVEQLVATGPRVAAQWTTSGLRRGDNDGSCGIWNGHPTYADE